MDWLFSHHFILCDTNFIHNMFWKKYHSIVIWDHMGVPIRNEGRSLLKVQWNMVAIIFFRIIAPSFSLMLTTTRDTFHWRRENDKSRKSLSLGMNCHVVQLISLCMYSSYCHLKWDSSFRKKLICLETNQIIMTDMIITNRF